MKRILFHGTSHIINEFNESFTVKGFEPNSALGIHFTDDIQYAIEYAERSKILNQHSNEAMIIIVSYESNGQDYIYEYEEFYGDHDEGTNTKEHFSSLRQSYLENNITTLLIPEKIKIINTISINQSIELSKILKKDNISWKEPEKILSAINNLNKQSKPIIKKVKI